MLKFKVKGRLLSVMISVILGFSIIVNVLIYFQFHDFITNNMLKTNMQLSMQVVNAKFPGEWISEGDKLYKGNKLINNDFSLVDAIKSSAGVECTIFLKDTRVSTTVENNGSRGVGTKADQKIIDTVLSGGQDYLGSANVLNKAYKTIYVPIKDNMGKNIGMFFVGIDKSTIDQQIQGMLTEIIISTLITILIITPLLLYLIAKTIIKPINNIKTEMDSMSSGDLTSTISTIYLNRGDEFGDICRSIQNTKCSLRKIIENIKILSQKTDVEAENLASVSKEISSCSETVTTSIVNVSEGSNKQLNNILNITSSLQEFGYALETMVHDMNIINSSSNEIYSMANTSNDNMQILFHSITNISNLFKEFVEKILGLQQNINQVNEITNFINSISDKTNLLALNASIEAARAGDAGKGFAVVANEIRNLADQSKKSSETINDLINKISVNTNIMTTNTNVMDDELTNQSTVIYNAIESFEVIIRAINEVIPKINAVNTTAINIEKEKNSIADKVDTISLIAKDFTASTEEISASSAEMSSSTEEVSAVADHLNTMTRDMLTEINKFKL